MKQSNFNFLSEHWAFLIEDAQQVEGYALRDPRAAAIYARRTLELALKWLFANDTALKHPYEKSLAAMIHEPTFASNIKKGLFHDIKFIHRLGNVAVHSDQTISNQEGLKTTVALHQFLGWMVRVYTRGGAAPGAFQITLLPKAEPDRPKLTARQLEKIQADLKAKDEAAVAAKEKLTQTEAQLAELKEQLALLQTVKDTNQQTIGSDEYSESETRELIIDVMLREAGWDPKSENVEEYEVTNCMPTASGERTGTGYVDYVLWGKDGKPLALVEAKRTRKDPRVGKRQAELYADCLEQHFGQRPIIYYSNGYTTWLWDDRFYPPREVQGFAIQDELQWRLNQRSNRKDLSRMQPKKEITGRYYQMEAAARVMEAFGAQRRRKSLIVMATGSGKTRLSISLVDMLMRGGWLRKALFLADRTALVRQAKREFVKHLPHVATVNMLEKASLEERDAARVVFSTYPTMLNTIDGTRKEIKETFSVGHFDLVIIDEAHRSVYQKFGAIFDYFDSLLLGLTATPRGEVDRNTYKLFELDDHQPTYAYELDAAVKDGFLVPPKAIAVPMKFQREGIRYKDLSAEEQEEYEQQERFYDEETGQLKEQIEPPALNDWLFNKDTVNKVLMHLTENGIKVEGGDRLGKTILFAKNSKHADFIVEQFDKNYPHLAGKFCRKIDYSVNYAQSLIDDFSIKEKDPQLVVSVDMLDTGIDVPEVVNLVFFKLVRSKTKFWQMIGRGTRLCENLFGPGQDKKEFIVFDYCQNLEFFDANPDGYVSPAQESVKQKIFKRRLELMLALQDGEPEDEHAAMLGEQLKDQAHAVLQTMNLDNFIVRKQRKLVETYGKRERWEKISGDDVSALADKVSGLPSPDDDHETARRFDLLILNLQKSVLQRQAREIRTCRNKLQKIAHGLEEKSAIPGVAAQMELILDLQKEQWWAVATLPVLEDVRIRLRELIRFIGREQGLEDVYTNFEDAIGGKVGDDPVEYVVVKTDPNLKEYRERVQRFIREHQDYITIRRLKNNQPVTKTDIAALEEILFSEQGPMPRKAYHDAFGDQPLGVLVRSVVGLERNAAKEAFADFLSEAPLHPDQISFLDEVVEYLVKNGTMQPKVMFETPFTHIHDQGVVGVFGEDNSRKIVELVRHINENAGVAV
ncbi:MAG: DEAD/DEAH box helicase family protein [Gammaproteobacteria bacterium]|nr:DEAD/DEAH box helicase family protein [Gammaproteobacteria bacterium]